ncbi:outer membrane protein [Maritimibacter sp. HL-12]|uniref:outer membrane protein n=1 Tax=Maritimibacter sp. HL-12 TaxID=1162418 RepID=UPI000A0F15D3|nr:outer membrane beta-barrel protein [Maritimibacter sp. HL-12]SMH55941.1 Opacity protein [Maritimibacter sp. HL-12]
MFRRFLTTTSIALLAAVPAIADGPSDPVVEPAPTFDVAQPVSDWTGFYAGANVTAGVTGGGTQFWGPGIQAGYLYDTGEFVFGGEASYNYLIGGDHLGAVDAIFGYDAGNVMPHLTLGGTYLSNEFGVSGGAGLSVKATENVLLNARYRYSYYPGVPAHTHQGIVSVSYRF